MSNAIENISRSRKEKEKDRHMFLVDAGYWRHKLLKCHYYLAVNPNAKNRTKYMATGEYQHPNVTNRTVFEMAHRAGY